MEQSLREKVKALGIESQIGLAGNVRHEELMAYLARADAFVLNTGYEGFSHAILEAMAMGTVVITTSVGGNSELIVDGENGFLVEFNNQAQIIERIDYVLRMSDEEREQIIIRAKETARQFTKDRMLKRTVELVTSL